MKDAPEYLLSIVVQITGALLGRINVPDEEIDKFSEQIKERRMGRLFENFETYDVQETVSDLMETYNLSDEEAHKTVELFWKE